MAKYITIAPNGKQVTISHSYGSKTFAHNEIIDNDKLAVIFPNVFHKIADEVQEAVETVTEFVSDVVDAVKEEIQTVTENVQDFVEDVKSELLDSPEPPPKKKAGRPAGAKNKPKAAKKTTKKKE